MFSKTEIICLTGCTMLLTFCIFKLGISSQDAYLQTWEKSFGQLLEERHVTKKHKQMPLTPLQTASTRPAGCAPKTHVGFLKTHKAGSSTVQNILFRYGWKHNLSFAFHPTESVIMNSCDTFDTSMVWNAPWHHLGYDMLAQHVIWNTKQIKRIMPSDTVYIQVIRDPVAMTKSGFRYFHLEKYYNTSLKNTALQGRKSAYYNNRFACFGRNEILFDFGMTSDHFDNETAVKEKILEADKIFDLVLIAEFFEESVVLLKDLLCWELDDVTYVKKNLGSPKYGSGLTSEEIQSIREMNRADQVYYDYFLQKLKLKMREYGEEKLREEVRLLKEKNRAIYENCVEDIEDEEILYNETLFHIPSKLGDVNQLTKCAPYVVGEIFFTDLLKDKQRQRLVNKV